MLTVQTPFSQSIGFEVVRIRPEFIRMNDKEDSSITSCEPEIPKMKLVEFIPLLLFVSTCLEGFWGSCVRVNEHLENSVPISVLIVFDQSITFRATCK